MAKAQITGARAAEATYVEGKGSAIEMMDIKSNKTDDSKTSIESLETPHDEGTSTQYIPGDDMFSSEFNEPSLHS